MTEQEYIAEINRLKSELADLKKAKRHNYVLPIEIGMKYGGRKTLKGKTTCYLDFISDNALNELSKTARFCTCGTVAVKEENGTVVNKVKLIDALTEEEYAVYLECIDRILAVLYEYYERRITE